jgi:hypothetical protein
MRLPSASRHEHFEQSDSGVTRLAWLLAAVLALSIGVPVAVGMLFRFSF